MTQTGQDLSDAGVLAKGVAAKRVAASPVPIEFVGLDGQELTLGDESVDAALSTFTLCTIPDVTRALSCTGYCGRAGGSTSWSTAWLPSRCTVRWQHRLNGMQH
jgi:hypothetical protein